MSKQPRTDSLREAALASIVGLPVGLVKHGVSFDVSTWENLRGTVTCSLLGIFIYYCNRRFFEWRRK